jgi:hypothetical protein
LHITQIYKQSNSVDAAQNHSWLSSSTVRSKTSILLILNDMLVAQHYFYFIQVFIFERVGSHASGMSSIPVITHATVSPFFFFFWLKFKSTEMPAFLEIHKQNSNHQTHYLSPELQRTEKQR